MIKAKELNDRHIAAFAPNGLGVLAWLQERDYQWASTLLHESLALHRELKDIWGTCITLVNLGVVELQNGDYDRATRDMVEGLELARRMKDSQNTAVALENLGAIAVCQGDYAKATAFFQEALAQFREQGSMGRICEGLRDLALH